MGDIIKSWTLKHETLSKYSNPAFVETGCMVGATLLMALMTGFRQVYGIEIDEDNCNIAKTKLDKFPAVVIHGDSSTQLSRILEQLKTPATFWLDAHGTDSTPILQELEQISHHPIKTHTILIDDRRLMGNQWKVTEMEVIAAIKWINPNYKISYEDNVVATNDIIVAKY
jgi:hypothetical protein